LAQLRKNNAAPNLQGATLDPKTGDYRTLDPGEALPPGASIWLGATTSFLPWCSPPCRPYRATARAHTKSPCITAGNQVANPTLADLVLAP